MAAIDLSAPGYLPFVKRTTGIGTTCQKYTLPANHGPLLLTIQVSAAAKVAFDTALTDGGAMGSDYEDIATANSPFVWDIPATSKGGVTAFYLAAASGTVTASVEITRPGAQ